MNYKILPIVIVGLICSNPVNSASIYKCTKNDKSVIFTDKECPANTETSLIHKETEQEIANRLQEEKVSTIKRLIAGNQANAAKEYAQKNNLSEVYYEQLSIYSDQKVAEEKQHVEAEKQQQIALQLQALAIQRQRIAVERAQAEQRQQTSYNQGYYGYNPRLRNSYRTPYSQSHHIPAGGMNPPMSSFPQMNPPMSFSSPMNPPQSFSGPMNVHGSFQHR